MTQFQAVLFDFDDTVADTFPARIAAMESAFAAAGVEEKLV